MARWEGEGSATHHAALPSACLNYLSLYGVRRLHEPIPIPNDQI